MIHVMLEIIVREQTLLKLHAQEDISAQQEQSTPRNTLVQPVLIHPQGQQLPLIALLVDQVNSVPRVASSNTTVHHGQHAQEVQETIRWNFALMVSILTRVIQQPVCLVTSTTIVLLVHHIL